ncbi:unnamed protein product [Victoria cruziana]
MVMKVLRRAKLVYASRHKRKERTMAFRRNRRISQHSIRGRIQVLEQLVPGCQKLDAGSIFRRAADYIMFLQVQVKLMQRLCDMFHYLGYISASTWI